MIKKKILIAERVRGIDGGFSFIRIGSLPAVFWLH